MTSGVAEAVVLIQYPPTLKESYHDDDKNHNQNQVDHVPAEWGDERPEQPQKEQDQDDRFECVTRHE